MSELMLDSHGGSLAPNDVHGMGLSAESKDDPAMSVRSLHVDTDTARSCSASACALLVLEHCHETDDGRPDQLLMSHLHSCLQDCGHAVPAPTYAVSAWTECLPVNAPPMLHSVQALHEACWAHA